MPPIQRRGRSNTLHAAQLRGVRASTLDQQPNIIELLFWWEINDASFLGKAVFVSFPSLLFDRFSGMFRSHSNEDDDEHQIITFVMKSEMNEWQWHEKWWLILSIQEHSQRQVDFSIERHLSWADAVNPKMYSISTEPRGDFGFQRVPRIVVSIHLKITSATQIQFNE